MKSELRDKIIAYNKDKAKKAEMASDLEYVLERLYKIYAVLEPFIPAEVKAIFEKYGYNSTVTATEV